MARLMLLRKTLRDARTTTVAIGVANALMALFVVLIYPEYRDQLKDFQMPEAFRGLLGEAAGWSTPAGFLSAEFFSWVPLLLITLAIIAGSGAIAGEESAGTLDLLLAQPIPRPRLLLEKAAALTLALLLAALASIPGFLLGRAFVDIDLTSGRLVLAVLNMVPPALMFLTLSLWMSAALPGRGAAAAVATGAVVVAYFLNTVGAAVDLLETPRRLTPFYWSDASRVLLHGFHEWARWAVMLAISGVFLALAVRAFARRDIAAGAREWQPRLSLPLLHRHRTDRVRGEEPEHDATPEARGRHRTWPV